MITFIANLTWQLANFNPKIIFFHYGTLIDTVWLAIPTDFLFKDTALRPLHNLQKTT